VEAAATKDDPGKAEFEIEARAKGIFVDAAKVCDAKRGQHGRPPSTAPKGRCNFCWERLTLELSALKDDIPPSPVAIASRRAFSESSIDQASTVRVISMRS
jgi:hypothetical protein